MKKLVLGAVFAVASGLIVGCAPTLKVAGLEPAPINFGSAKQLSVVQSEGRRSAREEVIAELTKQTRATGYFTAKDRSEEGITLKVAGRNATAEGGTAPQAADEIYARVDVLDWSADKETKTSKDSKGKETTTTVYTGKVVLGITAMNAKGAALIAEKEYEARLSGDDEHEAISASASKAVSDFLMDITPKQVTREIRLDDSDEGQKAIIETAKNGAIAQALEQLRTYSQDKPTNAAAHYNLAVLLDASGNYTEALQWYDKATSESTKDFYVSAKAACAKRLADAEALAQ